MEILEEFQIYLKKWCKEHHKPCPRIDQLNKYWQEAWEDFMKTDLADKWEDKKEEYMNIQLLTKSEQRKLKKREKDKVVEEESLDISPDETNEKESSWQRMQKYLR